MARVLFHEQPASDLLPGADCSWENREKKGEEKKRVGYRHYSCTLKGSTKILGVLLAHTVSKQFPTVGLSAEAWQQALVGLQYDPCKALFERLLGEVEPSGPKATILLDGAGPERRLVFQTGCGARVGIAFSSHASIRLAIDARAVHMPKVACIAAQLMGQGVPAGSELMKEVAALYN